MTLLPCRALAASALLLAVSVQGQCPPQGITLTARGGRLGDAWSIAMSGRPFAPGALGLDVSPGPVTTPIGTICLGFTPSLVLLPFAFDAAGAASIGSVLPPIPAFHGVTLYTSAVAVDPTRPSGFGISNGASLRLHEPRQYFIYPGVSTPFGSTPGSLAALDAITESVAFSQPLTTTVRDAIFVRERGWLVLLLGNGTLAAIDGTGASVLNVALTGLPATAARLLAPPGGDRLVLMSVGTPPNPFGPGTPGSVHLVSLPSGTVTTTSQLTAGNPDTMIQVPGSTTVFLRLANAVVPVDSASALLYPTIPLPPGFVGLVDWQVAGNTLYCLHSGRAATAFGGAIPAALSAVDVATQTVVFTNQLTLAPPLQILRAGPGTTGPSLYAYGPGSGTLGEFAQGSGAPTGTVAVGAGIAAMELSALGTQWLLLCNDAACNGPVLLSMPAGTMTLAPLAPLPAGAQPLIAVSPSAGYGKACLAFGNNTAVPFLTDPFAALSPPTTLPITATLFKVVSD